MKRLLWLLPVLLIAAFVYAVYTNRNAPPEIACVTPKRERLVSTLVTNGKVEPHEWSAVVSEREGAINSVPVREGQVVTAGQTLAVLDSSDARSELAAAEARIAQARAELDLLKAGGRRRDIAEIESAAASARLNLDIARREVESLERLVAKKAATRSELDRAKERVAQLEGELVSLKARQSALVSPQDTTAAEARLRDLQATAESARRRIELSVIRAPITGTLYKLDVRAGGYLRPGDSVGQIGSLDRVRVRVFVDEPELGNVRLGLPVTITWDALPGRQWTGTVERLPAQIVALGSRQVGEVVCVIENEGRTLVPNTNVNAEIRLHVVENALTVPKEVLRREGNVSGVFVLREGKALWRTVELGAASVTRIEVKQGVENDACLALPTDRPIRDGSPVKAIPGQS